MSNKQDWKNMDLGISGNGIRQLFIKRLISPFRKYRKLLEKSQWWSKGQIEKYQFERLRTVLKTAYHHVPYYRGLFEVYGININKFESLKDIAKLPILEKDDIRLHHRELVSTSMAYPTLYKCSTSGTSGTPITLYRDIHNVGFEYAMLLRQKIKTLLVLRYPTG